MDRKTTVRRMTSMAAAAALALAASGPVLAEDHEKTQESWQGQASDAWVDGKIEASYALNRYLNPFEIDTHVDEGVVTLSGSVESQIDKDLAGQIAQGVDGVREVKNELAVEPNSKRPAAKAAADRSFGDRVDDATTTARVKYALVDNESTQGFMINVDTTNGTVTLRGDVTSDQERQLAEKVARNTEGVHDVQNELKVTTSS